MKLLSSLLVVFCFLQSTFTFAKRYEANKSYDLDVKQLALFYQDNPQALSALEKWKVQFLNGQQKYSRWYIKANLNRFIENKFQEMKDRYSRQEKRLAVLERLEPSIMSQMLAEIFQFTELEILFNHYLNVKELFPLINEVEESNRLTFWFNFFNSDQEQKRLSDEFKQITENLMLITTVKNNFSTKQNIKVKVLWNTLSSGNIPALRITLPPSENHLGFMIFAPAIMGAK